MALVAHLGKYRLYWFLRGFYGDSNFVWQIILSIILARRPVDSMRPGFYVPQCTDSYVGTKPIRVRAVAAPRSTQQLSPPSLSLFTNRRTRLLSPPPPTKFNHVRTWKRRQGTRKGRRQTSPQGPSRQYPGHHQARHPPSRPPWRCQAHPSVNPSSQQGFLGFWRSSVAKVRAQRFRRPSNPPPQRARFTCV